MSGADKEPAAVLYRLPGHPGVGKPGVHGSRTDGHGMLFSRHARLFDRPDPRRLDLIASLKNVRRDWLVRATVQRSATTVQFVVDVSASMHFGEACPKLGVAADLVEAVGKSAFRAGDALGMMAFDTEIREDLLFMPRNGRGVGQLQANALRAAAPREPTGTSSRWFRRAPTIALQHADLQATLRTLASALSSRVRLLFLVSDLHFELDALQDLLQAVPEAMIVPVVIWDPAEVEPPSANGWVAVTDSESGRRQTLWLSPQRCEQWREHIRSRRAAIDHWFDARGIPCLYLDDGFDAEAVSRYFLETVHA